MKKALLSLTVLSLVAVLTPSAVAATTVSAGSVTLPVRDHGTRLLAEAFPASSSALEFTNPCHEGQAIEENGVFCGEEVGGHNTTAAPGVFALKSVSVSETDPRQRLNVNCFATCPDGQFQPFVQSCRLIKNVPGSNKCPATFGPRTFFQFGSGIRTWWTLIFTQPGTTFTLELTVRCLLPNTKPVLHIDRWTWEVVATFESLQLVIDVLHSGAIGTTEIPCIASEDMFLALKQSVSNIETIITDDPENIVDAQDELFKTEALLIAFCAFTDCFIPEDVFSAQFPPSNDMQFGDFGWTGVIDTLENPCCCKIMVDIESIGQCYNITFN